MNPDSFDIVLRRRSAWEAVDLGVALLRSQLLEVYLPWTLLLASASTLVWACFGPIWGCLVLWLLLPLLDRLVLQILSRAVFRQATSLKEALRIWPASLKNGLLRDVLLHRIFGRRSVLQPIWVLEGLSFGDAGRRERDFSSCTGSAQGLSFFYLKIEALVTLGIFMQLAPNFMPEIDVNSEGLWAFIFENLRVMSSAMATPAMISWVIAIWLLRPFGIAGGFLIYLNQRMIGEGWDLELQFRSLAARLAPLLLVAALFLPAFPSAAAEPVEPSFIQAPGEQSCRRILETEEFRTVETRRLPRPKFDLPKQTNLPPFALTLGLVMKWLLIAALAAALVYLCWLLYRYGLAPRFPSSSTSLPDEPRLAALVPEAPAPSGVGLRARRLAEGGQTLAAAQLLYREGLETLRLRQGLRLRPGVTEGEALRELRPRGDLVASFFVELVPLLIAAAYAGRPPAAERLLPLADRWESVFAGGAS